MYFFSLKRNYTQIESLTQSELSAIERIAAKSGIHVKIEVIENGTIIYLDDTFPKEHFLKLKETLLHNVKVLPPDTLPEKYGTWHDSVSGDMIYFSASGEEFLQFSSKIITQFLGKGEGSKLVSKIHERIIHSTISRDENHDK